MSTQTLASIAMNVVGQYNEAGKQLVRAYRAGTERAVEAVSERFATTVNARSLPLVNDTVKGSLIDAQQQVAGLVSFGLGLGANGADTVIEQVSRRVNSGIERLSDITTGVEAAFETQALEKVGVFVLPAAYASLELASVVAQGTKRLSDRVAGADEEIVAEPVKPAAKKRAPRAARRA